MITTRSEYRDRLRILLILYYFSEDYNDVVNPNLVKVFRSEVRIQKIDFLIRYPDYLCYELLELIVKHRSEHDEIKEVVKNVFSSGEPEIRREDMLRYLFGAYEDIDDIISFLVSIGFIHFESKRNVAGCQYEKSYFITDQGKQKIENQININLPSANWYGNRCQLIRKFFGDLTGTELKVRQYRHLEYKETVLGEYIQGINSKVKERYKQEFGEDL